MDLRPRLAPVEMVRDNGRSQRAYTLLTVAQLRTHVFACYRPFSQSLTDDSCNVRPPNQGQSQARPGGAVQHEPVPRRSHAAYAHSRTSRGRGNPTPFSTLRARLRRLLEVALG